jgi:hypothetical protein
MSITVGCALLALISCISEPLDVCDREPTPECPERPDDPSGYTQVVCKYVVDRGYDYDDPGGFKVLSVQKGPVAAPEGMYGTTTTFSSISTAAYG